MISFKNLIPNCDNYRTKSINDLLEFAEQLYSKFMAEKEKGSKRGTLRSQSASAADGTDIDQTRYPALIEQI